MKSIIKTIILVAAIGLISSKTIAQQVNNVPQPVLTAFSAKYPQVKVKKWKTKGDTCIAEYTMANKKYRASYSKDGMWLSTERSVKHRSTLPAGAWTYLKTSKYASWHVDDMAIVRTPTNQKMYDIYIDNNSGNQSAYENAGSVSDRRLCFNTNGKLIKVDRL